jgi:N-acetyltransferase 10
MTPFDLKRLESYANNMLDYHVILDLLPAVAALYFEKRLGEDVRVSAVQSAILLALGMQRKTIEDVEVRVPAPASCARELTPWAGRAAAPRRAGARALHEGHAQDQQAPHGHPARRDQRDTPAARRRGGGGGGAGGRRLAARRGEHGRRARRRGERGDRGAAGEAARDAQRARHQPVSAGGPQRMCVFIGRSSGPGPRYAIDDAGADWAAAEAQVARPGRSTVVSVKKTAGAKRKAGDEPDGGAKAKKTTRRSKKAKS